MQNLYNLITREEAAAMIPRRLEGGVSLTPGSPLARGLPAGARSRQGGGGVGTPRRSTAIVTGP